MLKLPVFRCSLNLNPLLGESYRGILYAETSVEARLNLPRSKKVGGVTHEAMALHKFALAQSLTSSNA